MLGHLLGRTRWPIALDIGTNGIKMLQMHRVGGGIAVLACQRWQFPPSAGTDADTRRRLTIDAVRDMLRRGGFRGNRVVSALSCEQLKIKNVRLPDLTGPVLQQALHDEAHDRFGQVFAPDQLHFLHAGEIRQGSEAHHEFILLAAPSEVVEGHYSMLLEMGLRPEHIDAEPLAMFRPFARHLRRRADEGEISVVVDLGHLSTKVVVARGRAPVLVKRIPIGGRDFAEAVAKQLDLSYEEAVDLRIQFLRDHSGDRDEGQDSAGAEDLNSVSWTILDAVRGHVEELSREVALCLRYCSVTFRGLRPKRVLMTGGEAYDPAMIRLLGEQLGVECAIGQPLRGIDTSHVEFEGDRRGMLAEWSVCVGLALRDEQADRSSRKKRHEADRLSA